MSADAWSILTVCGFAVVLLSVLLVIAINAYDDLAGENRSLAAELRRERKHADEAIALAGRLRNHYEAHVTDVINDNTRLRERLAAVEGRELPWLDEIRAARGVANRAAALAARRSI